LTLLDRAPKLLPNNAHREDRQMSPSRRTPPTRHLHRSIAAASSRQGRGCRDGSRNLGLPAQAQEIRWDREADVVIIGAGASGLPAAIAARRRAPR
jgi:hypothetical protein